MKDTKRKLMPFTFYDRSGIEQPLEEEAQYRYLICYPGYIVEIDLDGEPTADQMQIIAQKLLSHK